METRTFVYAILAAASLSNALLGTRALVQSHYRRQALPFAALCLAMAIYSSGYLFELSSKSVQDLYLALAYEYVGLAFLPAFWILLAREFMGKASPWPLRAILIGLSSITLILVATVPLHQWYYRDLKVNAVAGMAIVSFGRAPWYWVQTIYLNMSFLYGTAVFAREAFGQHRARKSQAFMMLAGSIAPWIAYIFYLSGAVPYGLEPGSLALSISAPFFAYGFFRYRLFELAPLARDAVFEQMKDAVVVIDEEGRIADLNEAAAKLPGMDRNFTKTGTSIDEAFRDSGAILSAYRGKASSLAIPLLVGDTLKRFDLNVSRLVDKRGRRRGEALVLTDATEHSALTERLSTLANTDELTGLLSRRRFFEMARIELARARRYKRPIALAIMDMDKFKQVNDTWGHLAGDKALKLFAVIAGSCLRACDLLGRIGGDEFAFIFPETDGEGAGAAMGKLQARVALGKLTFEGTEVFLSASAGWAGSPGPEHPELDELFAHADRMLYQNKQAEK